MSKIFPQFGSKPKGESLLRIRESANFNGKIFVNQIPTPMRAEGVKYRELWGEFFKKNQHRTPSNPVPNIANHPSLVTDHSSLIWFGHSTLLMNISGYTILTDPVFSNRASPFSFMGPKAFPGSLPYSVDEIPDPDVILLSHDHYDHLDYKTIKKIHHRTTRFIVPLGVGAHLIHWGINPSKIIELDWWEKIILEDGQRKPVILTSTPQRHFSGRGTLNRNTSLWCAWVIRSGDQKIYWGADGGYSPVFKEIGEKFGPFDYTLLECGAYSKYWPNIHSLPEQTVQSHLDLKGKILIPIHWGKFNLSIHPWMEPIERVMAESEKRGVDLKIPVIGELVISDQ